MGLIHLSVVPMLFVLLVVYQIKHWLADYLLQTDYMLGKFRPGWDFVPPLLAHASVHAGFTLLIAVIVSALADVPVGLRGYAFLIALFDGVVHFCMDRVKASPRMMGRWKGMSGREYVENLKNQQHTRDITANYAKQGIGYEGNIEYLQGLIRGNTYFWWCLGIDQMVHHLTHYACVYFILRLGGWL